MGRGNALPSGCSEYRGWYLDFEAIYGEDYWENKNEWELHDSYEDWKTQMIEGFRDRFPSLEPPNPKRWLGRETYVLLENYQCVVTLDDNESSIAIHVGIADDRELYGGELNLAIRNMNIIADWLFEWLRPYGEYVGYRTSAWTSGRCFPKKKAA